MQGQRRSEIVSDSFELESDDIELLDNDIIKRITHAAISNTRKYIIMTTALGFVITDLHKLHYIRYQGKKSPFYVQDSSNEIGSQLGYIIEKRSQVALVPNFNSKRYKQTSIYIYDYSIKMMLSKFDFNLPINHFSITNHHLVVSNNKRIVLYNYLKSRPEYTEEYYLSTYKSEQNVDFIKYFEMNCHLYDPNHPQTCQCGTYSHTTTTQYLKLLYMKIGNSHNIKNRILYLYDERLNKETCFDVQKSFTDNFYFHISEDGRYVALSEDYGRKIHVYSIGENCLFSVLYLGRQIKEMVNLGVVQLPNGSDWLIAARENKKNSKATMHMFKLAKSSPTEIIYSRYKRSFKLYKKTMQDYSIFEREDTFINPFHYSTNYKLYSISVLGEYCEIIDFNKAGLHDEGEIVDYKSMDELKE